MTYAPRSETREILDRAYEMVRSVPYHVSARWLFYRLLQEGYYSKKSDYKNKWLKAVSSARRAFYSGWHPDTLADDTRKSIIRGRGSATVEEWLQGIAEGAVCNLDKWDGQPYYLELWYEARAMTDQFRHYTEHITLRPMGGQPSIPYKWQIAKDLERVAVRYDPIIVILYFGDLDTHGEIISDVIFRDVGTWCTVDFTFQRCGLNADQVDLYGIPENPEKPGEYQWEALSDEGADQIITDSVGKYLRHGAFTAVESEEKKATSWIRGELVKVAANYRGDRDGSA